MGKENTGLWSVRIRVIYFLEKKTELVNPKRPTLKKKFSPILAINRNRVFCALNSHM